MATFKKAFFGCIGIAAAGFVLLVICAIVSGVGQEPKQEASGGTTVEDPPIAPIAITATDLWKAYKRNEVAANDKYQEQTLAITGRVDRMDDGSLGLTLYLRGPSVLNSVACSMTDDSRPQAAKLTRGQLVTVTGIGDGCTVFGDPLVRDAFCH